MELALYSMPNSLNYSIVQAQACTILSLSENFFSFVRPWGDPRLNPVPPTTRITTDSIERLNAAKLRQPTAMAYESCRRIT
jgi:hypothetical protein